MINTEINFTPQEATPSYSAQDITFLPPQGNLSALSPKSKDYAAIRLAYLHRAVDPSSNAYDNYYAAKTAIESSDDPHQVVQQGVDEFKQDFLKELLDTSGTLVMHGGDAQQITDVATEAANRVKTRLSGPAALQQAFILAANRTDDPMQKEHVAEQYFYHTLAKLTDQESWWDKLVYDVGSFIPGYTAWATSNFLGDKANIATAAFHFDNLAHKFNSLSPAEKIKIFPKLVEEAKKAGGTARAVEILKNLIDPSKAYDFQTTELINASTLVAPMAKMLKFGKKATSILWSMRKLGDVAEAGKLDAAALMDNTGEAADAVGVSREDAVLNAMPFETTPAFEGDAIDGISHATVTALRDSRRKMAKALNKVFNKENNIQFELLTPEEQTAAQEKYLESLGPKFEEFTDRTGWIPYNAKISDVTDTGFKVTADLMGRDAKGHFTGRIGSIKPIEVNYTYNDITGTIGADREVGWFQANMGSKSTFVNRFFDGEKMLHLAGQVENAQYRALNKLQKAIGPIFRKIPKAGMKKVDAVALHGDSMLDDMGNHASRVFTPTELMLDGIPTQDGLIRLTEQEAMGYYAQRDLFDALWRYKNNLVRQEYQLKGMQGVKIPTAVWGEDGYSAVNVKKLGRVIDPSELKGQIVLDARTAPSDGIPVTISSDEAAGILARDSKVKLVKLDGYHFLDKDNAVSHVLVDGRLVGNLPEQLLHYVPGFVPRFYTDYRYVVQEVLPMTLDGSAATRRATVRLFEKSADAKAWAAAQEAENPGSRFEARHVNDLPQAEKDELTFENFGGVYTRPRSTRNILYNLEGDVPKRISLFDAMERNLAHIATQFPLRNLKHRLIVKFRHLAKDVLSDPEDWMSPLKTTNNPALDRGIKEAQDWVRSVLHLPGRDDRILSGVFEGIARWAEGHPLLGVGEPLRKTALKLAEANPMAFARTAAFKGYLGWFNFIEFFVQAQGAAIALALDPLNAPRYLNDYMALRMAMAFPESEEWVNLAGKIRATGDLADFRAMVKEFDKSGWKDSLRQVAEYNKPESRFTLVPGWFRRASDKGLVFYREGEMFNRMYAWTQARHLWKKANGLRAVDEAGLREINNTTLDLTLHMNRAARAKWQEGLLSLPTQFMPIQFRYIEASLPKVFPLSAKTFSKTQAARMLLGQIALYGTAGVPLGTWAIGEMASLFGTDPSKLSEHEKAAINGGLWGYLADQAFGAPMDLSNRLSITGGISQMLETLAGEGPDATISAAAMGAFGSMPSRAYQAFSDAMPIFGTWADGFTPTSDELLEVALDVGSLASSFSNARKARLWLATHTIRDSNQNVILNLDNATAVKVSLAKALGIQPEMLHDYYALKSYNYNHSEEIYQTVTALLELTRKTLANQDWNDPRVRKAYYLKKQFLLQGLSPIQLNKVRDQFRSRYSDNESNLQKTMQTAIDNYMSTGSWSTGPLQGNIPTNEFLTPKDKQD